MHRVGFLFDKICSMDNLRSACILASKGKKKRSNVKRFFNDAENKLKTLQKHLLDGTYRCMPYSKKIIQDKGSGKLREISIPKFYPDQIVQWAIMNVIKPVLSKGMYVYSCASIEGRGIDYGYKKLKKVLERDKKHTKYCLKCDVRKFYPNIDQDILMEKFKKKIKDQKALNLIETIVRSVPSGLPIGNYTSQWFANFFLQDLDHYIKEELHIKYYIRYMDDLVMLDSNKRKLHKARKQLQQFLKTQNLLLKNDFQVFKVANSKCSGRFIDFLGFKFFGDFVLLRGRTFLRAIRRISKVGEKDYLTAKDASAVFSYASKFEKTSGNLLYSIYVKPKINMNCCRLAISKHDKLQAQNTNILRFIPLIEYDLLKAV